jgi:PAS domain S-box-containing protein
MPHYREFLEGLPSPALVIEGGSTILFGNIRFAALLGRQAGELEGLALTAILPEMTRGAGAAEAARQLVQSGNGGREVTLRRPDGRLVAVEARVNAIRAEGPPLVVVLVEDITEHKRVEAELLKSEERLQQAIRVSQTGIFDHDQVTDTIYWSPEQRANYGWGPDEPVTLEGFLAQVYPADRERIAEAVRRAHDPAGGGLFDVEHRIIRRDGKIRWLLTRSRTFFAGEGAERHPVRTVGAVVDVTERQEADEELRLFREAADRASEGVFWMDRDASFRYVNEAACRSLGYSREELLQLRLWDIDPVYPRASWEQRWTEFERRAAPNAATFESVHRRKDGSLFPVEVLAQHILLERGGALHVSYVRDITERKRIEDSLRRSEARLSEAQRLARIGSWELDLVTGTLTWSDEIFRIFELDPSRVAVSYQTFLELVHPEDRTALDVAYNRSLRERTPYEITHRLLLPDGRIKHIHERGITLYDAAGVPQRSAGTAQDVTERMEAESALRLKEQVIATSISGIAIADGAGKLLYVNPAMVRLWGYADEQEMLARQVTELAEEREVHRIIEQLQRQGAWQGELTGRRKDGSRFDLLLAASAIRDAEGRVVSMMGSLLDVTERRRLEAQFLQAQKMESIGRLAGGIAHDFNNLLTAISGCIELALLDLRPGDPLRELLTDARKAGESAAGLTQQLLAFSRKQVISPRVMNLNDVLGQVQKMLQRLLGEDIDLRALPAPDLGQTRMDPGQMEQILVNLAVNARDAMPTGGRLTVETANVTLDEEYHQRHPHIQPGEYVMLAVSDEGAGMNEEVLAHLFEPFFTTKGVGKGTGLGLAMVYGAIKQNRGSIEVYSEVGHGTTFKMYLPRVHEPPEESPVRLPQVLPRGTETILLVEDEARVRAVAVRLLSRLGYTVHACGNAVEALETVRAITGPIHLLITDVVLPGTNGRTLARQVTALRPETRVLFASGYTANVVVNHGVLEQGIEFVAKPYSIELLAQRVREVLDRA